MEKTNTQKMKTGKTLRTEHIDLTINEVDVIRSALSNYDSELVGIIIMFKKAIKDGMDLKSLPSFEKDLKVLKALQKRLSK